MNKKTIRIFQISFVIGVMALAAMPLTIRLSAKAKGIFASNSKIQALNLNSLSVANGSPFNKNSDSKLANVAELAKPQTYANLPVGSVSSYPVQNSWGTVLLIPQFHRYPGTALADSSNDSAQVAQSQIYDIMSYVNKQYGIKFAMAEGDLYGPVPNEKITSLTDKISLRNEFSSGLDQLKKEIGDNPSPADQQLLNDSTRLLATLDREIILQGAPYKLKAEGGNVNLYGSEVKSTQDKSATIVRNYIYLQDREKTLVQGNISQSSGLLSMLKSGKSQAVGALSVNPLNLGSQMNFGTQVGVGSKTNSTLAKLYQQLLSRTQNGGNSLESDFITVESQASASGDSSLLGVLAKLRDTYYKIKDNQVKGELSANKNSPSRQDNPYSGITDSNVIKSKLNESEKQIQSVVIDQRNVETAENFAQGLKAENTDIGFLQFGAGHEAGLIEQLNKQGLSVVVVTPTEVANRPDNEK